MDEVHYLISDASRKVDVEAHVLRYWEEELELAIPRNEMGHRYYTDFHIRLFKQVKNLKEKGYQLKAIKHALEQMKKDGKLEGELTDEILEQDMDAALKELKEEEKEENTAMVSTSADGSPLPVSAEEKMAQFQQMMNLIIGRALEVNNEKLSQDNSGWQVNWNFFFRSPARRKRNVFVSWMKPSVPSRKQDRRKLLQQKCHFLKENALDGGLRNFFTGKREVKENKKNNKNKEKEGQARERCYGSCFWFVLFCDFLKTVKNIEK